MSLLLSDYWLHFSTNVGITALAALGLYVCFSAGQYSLAHAALMGSGAYAAGLIAVNTGAPYPVGLLIGIIVGAAVGGLMGLLLALRLREFYLAIGTLAFNLAAIVVVNNNDSLGGTLGLFGVRLETTADQTVIAVIVVAIGVAFLERSRLGRAMRALHDDELLAAANGVRVWRVKLGVWCISGAITGLAGAMYAHYLGIVRPDGLGFEQSVQLWVPVIVGGSTLVAGPILGAIVTGLIPEIINRRLNVDPILVSGVLLIAVTMFRPSGLLRKGDLRRVVAAVRRRRHPEQPGSGTEPEPALAPSDATLAAPPVHSGSR